MTTSLAASWLTSPWGPCWPASPSGLGLHKHHLLSADSLGLEANSVGGSLSYSSGQTRFPALRGDWTTTRPAAAESIPLMSRAESRSGTPSAPGLAWSVLRVQSRKAGTVESKKI